MREIFFPNQFPRVYGVRYFGQNFIKNLPVANITAPYQASIISVGERIYRDDTWLITESDFDFNRCSMIRTLSSRRASTEKKELSLTVTEPSRIYVAYDEKGSSGIPPWLKRAWKRTGRRIQSNQGHEYQLYLLETRQGTISFGGNGLGVQKPGQNYFIIVENLRHYNDVIERDVVDLTIDELRYTSDHMIQLFSRGMLIHNIGTDPMFPLQLLDYQFIQNGLSILEVMFFGSNQIDSHTENITYQQIISGPVVTGTTVIKYYEIINGQMVQKEKEVPTYIPAQLQQFTTTSITSTLTSKSFEELVEGLNIGVIPFVSQVEAFTPTPRQPKLGETSLSFTPQEPLIDPSIMIYGSDFIKPGKTGSIFWDSFNSSRIMLNDKEIDFKGHLTFTPTQTTSYQFKVEGDDQVLVTNYILQVETESNAVKLDLPQLTLQSSKKLTDPSDAITLTWSGENISQLYLGSELLTTNSGSINIAISENTEFVLKGINPNFTAEISLLVRITDIKPICCG